MALKIVCVNVGNYEGRGAEYVNKLHNAVGRNLPDDLKYEFIVFTDDPTGYDPGIHTREIPVKLEGWWNKLYLFKDGVFALGDRIVYFDLDTVITGPLDSIVAYDGMFAILRDFYRHNGLQSSVMLWRNGGPTDRFWNEWCECGAPKIEGGDQAWIEKFKWKEIDILQDLFPNDFISYKIHCNSTLLHKPKVVIFHGNPRPHEAGGWVDEVWKIGGGTALELMSQGNTKEEQLIENIKHSMSLGLESLKEVPQHDGIALFIGGGPSVNKNIDEIRERQNHGQKVFALNGSWRWLERKGITPDFHILLDARPENDAFVYHGNVALYYASQCSNNVFELSRLLAKLKCLSKPKIWHHINAQHLPELAQETLFIGGGSSVGLNALSIGAVLGYREMHLFGYDSSYESDQGHAYDQALNAKERTISVTCGGLDFVAAPWMVTQVEEFKQLAPQLLAMGCVLTVHGDGLLPHTARIIATAADSMESADGIMKVGETWWPVYDNECRRSMDIQLPDIQEIMPFVKNKGVCVQAGGNVGLWPKEFAKHFDMVYTFEPNPLNFKCLMRNCEESNIAKVEAALGDKDGNAAIQEVEGNCGACYIKDGDDFPVMTIDGLELDACDLIQLDIEGYELKALLGAAQTIEKFRPVIVVEDKGLSDKYGSKQGDIADHLAIFGYKVAKQVNRDIVFVCG